MSDELKALRYLAEANDKAMKQQEKIINRLRKAAKAFQDLNVCYRVGKNPSNKLLDDCGNGRKLLESLDRAERASENQGVEDYPANDGGLT